MVYKNIFEQRYYEDYELPLDARLIQEQPAARIAGAEVRILVSQGPKENRINLTMVGDGYTLAERDKFFSDANRITHELFTGSTFASYLPLFNVYAVFSPSHESGITDGDIRRASRDRSLASQ